MRLKVNLNEPRIREKVKSDRFGLLVSHEWKRLIDPYTPRDTGALMGIEAQVKEEPFSLHYTVPYAEIVYYNPRGVTYIRNGTGRNQFATQEWDIAAEKAGQLDKLYRILNNALASGRF